MIGVDETLAIASPLPTVGPVERALALRTFPLFQTMPARQVAILAQLMREHAVRRGTMLQMAGQPVRCVYLLRDGRVRQMGDGTLLAALEAPAALGLLDWLADERARASAVAETDVTALAIDGAALRDVLEENFSLILHMRTVLGGEIAALERELGCSESGPAATPTTPATPRAAPAGTLDLVGCLVQLQQTRELRRLGVAVLAALLRDEGTVRAAAGEELFAAGAEATRFLVLVDGEVTCTPPQPHAPFRARAGDILGRNAALSGLSYSYRAVADSTVVAIPIDAHVFWDVAEDHFHVAQAALAMGARQLITLKERQAALADSNRSVAPAAAAKEHVG